VAKSVKSEAYLLEQKEVLGRKLNALERSIKSFQIAFQRFLAGDIPVPPLDQGDSIQNEFRRLRNVGLRGVAEQYRMGSLEARFNSYRELFTRRERERERGTPRATKEVRPSPTEGVVVGKKGHQQAAEILYQGLFMAQGSGNPGMDLERFRSYLGKQADTVRAKTGCADVHFRVAVEDGKMKLKARPIR
jgi:hypothetical protein